jgi:hypothetical protein
LRKMMAHNLFGVYGERLELEDEILHNLPGV